MPLTESEVEAAPVAQSETPKSGEAKKKEVAEERAKRDAMKAMDRKDFADFDQ